MNQTLPEQQALRGYHSILDERKRADRMRKVWTWVGRIIRLGVVILAAFLVWRY